jgi:hypothetical protein
MNRPSASSHCKKLNRLIDGLDLVISVDTAVTHCALGKPVFLLNRFDTDWNWLLNRDDTPWHPPLRQFRHPSPGDWTGALGAPRDVAASRDQRSTRTLPGHETMLKPARSAYAISAT